MISLINKRFIIRKYAQKLRNELETVGFDGYHTTEQVSEELDLVEDE